MRMKTILNWLYENWMKGTPFLALYFLSNGLVSTEVNIVSIIVGIIAQASMMVYGFAYLVPTSKKEGYHRSVLNK